MLSETRALGSERLRGALQQTHCEQCQYYLQHFIKVGSQYVKTGCGHCIQGYVKKRKPEDACGYFELGVYEMKDLIKSSAIMVEQ